MLASLRLWDLESRWLKGEDSLFSRNSRKILSRQMGNLESLCSVNWRNAKVLGPVGCVCLWQYPVGQSARGCVSWYSLAGVNMILNITSWYSLQYCSSVVVVTTLILSLTVVRN
jgi:hypothetical protein